MSVDQLKAAAGGAPAPERQASPLVGFTRVLDNFKPQLKNALPKHLTEDRMARLAVTAFSQSKDLQNSDPKSILASIMTAAQLGLEPGVNGQGYLIPYWNSTRKCFICTFVPGWKGMQDLVNRSGRASSWTGAVYKGDEFNFELGDRPFIRHKPGDGLNEEKDLLFVYAVGRVNGSDWPIVDVWPIGKVKRHLAKYNRQGDKHYGLKNMEMYGRKLPLLQVIKYLPSSIELSNMQQVSNTNDRGGAAYIDGEGFINVLDEGDDGDAGQRRDGIDPDTGETGAPPPPAPRGKGPKGGAAAAAPKAEPAAAAATTATGKAPDYTLEQYTKMIGEAKDRDEAATTLDIARSEHGAAAVEPLAKLFRERFPGD